MNLGLTARAASCRTSVWIISGGRISLFYATDSQGTAEFNRLSKFLPKQRPTVALFCYGSKKRARPRQCAFCTSVKRRPVQHVITLVAAGRLLALHNVSILPTTRTFLFGRTEVRSALLASFLSTYSGVDKSMMNFRIRVWLVRQKEDL